ncbi:hypothetical protein [Shewanella holmiensis]|uniref:Uncharacterized protein n=1 Tax=Shewanella holmiensis TaxID=2952222 RepID=A0A9X3AX27_9GAMM|nr:hypothetical protein [Shewanella holmiensis]MCT7942858.1 hypothetical protein [Shewanella holmiensis]
MPKKVVETTIANTHIRFENTWLSGAKLIVDGKILVQDDSYLSLNKNSPLVAKKIVVEGVEHLIEVFVYAIFTVKIKIHVDGQYVAGDKF